MFRIVRVLMLFASAASFGACFAPHSKFYAPAGTQEEQLFATARRDVYPDDVRSAPGEYASQTVLWTGIVQQLEQVEPGKYRLVVEHHYWDWIEDYSIQREIAFLSPRGEGQFECRFTADANDPPERIARINDMAIVYGIPKRVGPDGTVIMACPFYKTLRRELYATDIFDYGRNGADMKVLRVPGLSSLFMPNYALQPTRACGPRG